MTNLNIEGYIYIIYIPICVFNLFNYPSNTYMYICASRCGPINSNICIYADINIWHTCSRNVPPTDYPKARSRGGSRKPATTFSLVPNGCTPSELRFARSMVQPAARTWCHETATASTHVWV